MTLSPGKMRGLQTTSNDRQIFTILAVDHGLSLAHTVAPARPETVTYEALSAVKQSVTTHLARYASAVLLDPVYGLAPAVLGGALNSQTGLLLAVEDGDYASVSREARLFDGWGVAQAKAAGANAIKCFFYYHPDDRPVADHQEKFVGALVEACAEHNLPLFAEPLGYNMTPATRPQVVIETARRISRLGIDVLKVEFPVDAAAQPDPQQWSDACAALNDACVTPWAILSAGVDFPTFAQQVETACRAGASGYLAGRAIWKEGVTLRGSSQTEFWQKTAAPRLQKLAAIATAHGRPWTAHYPFLSEMPDIGWHKLTGKNGGHFDRLSDLA